MKQATQFSWSNPVIIVTVVIILLGALLSVISENHYARVESSWQEHADRAAKINKYLFELNQQMGYGGFIHNFKNIVLRRDLQRYDNAIFANIQKTRKILDELENILQVSADKQALVAIRVTFEEYVNNYSKVKSLIRKGAEPNEIDKEVKVNDKEAVEALKYVAAQSARRLEKTKQLAVTEYKNAQRFLWFSRILFLFTVVFACFAVLRYQKKLTRSTEEAQTAKENVERLLNSSPDPMLTSDRTGRIVRSNIMAEEVFGYTSTELLKMSIEDLIPTRFRDRHKDMRKEFQMNEDKRVMQGKITSLFALTRDGREPNVDISISTHEDNGERLTTVILRDVTEREMRNQELIVSRQEAEKANQAKSEFLSSMSHELRTPMNAILGFAQLLECEVDLNDKQKIYAKEINKAGHHLLQLINDVLDLSKIETGNIDIELEAIDVASVINDCISLTKPLADLKSIDMSFSTQVKGLIKADRVRLKQVLLNLISNAIKYNREQGRIILEILPGENQRLRVCVKDTGVGIANDKLDKLFMPFHRLEELKNQVEGAGIGLNLSKQLTELMGGSIGVESTKDVGSLFWIEFKLDSEQETVQVERVDSDLSSVRTETDKILIKKPCKILYIEDNLANLALIQNIFSQLENVSVLTASSPVVGIELAVSERPDLILLDINIPGMNGYEVLEILKASSELNDVPILAISANAMPGDVVNGMKAGFNEYIAKPIDVKSFLTTVAYYLESKAPADYDWEKHGGVVK